MSTGDVAQQVWEWPIKLFPGYNGCGNSPNDDSKKALWGRKNKKAGVAIFWKEELDKYVTRIQLSMIGSLPLSYKYLIDRCGFSAYICHTNQLKTGRNSRRGSISWAVCWMTWTAPVSYCWAIIMLIWGTRDLFSAENWRTFVSIQGSSGLIRIDSRIILLHLPVTHTTPLRGLITVWPQRMGKLQYSQCPSGMIRSSRIIFH